MEWKRVKTILIGVLLITCLLLTGNILRQVRASKVQERQAVRDACGVAARTGVRIDAALVLGEALASFDIEGDEPEAVKLQQPGRDVPVETCGKRSDGEPPTRLSERIEDRVVEGSRQ